MSINGWDELKSLNLILGSIECILSNETNENKLNELIVWMILLVIYIIYNVLHIKVCVVFFILLTSPKSSLINAVWILEWVSTHNYEIENRRKIAIVWKKCLVKCCFSHDDDAHNYYFMEKPWHKTNICFVNAYNVWILCYRDYSNIVSLCVAVRCWKNWM